jgi:hypothetical protein
MGCRHGMEKKLLSKLIFMVSQKIIIYCRFPVPAYDWARVTRLGEISPNGYFLIREIRYLKTTEICIPHFWDTPSWSLSINLDKKMGWATFWVIFFTKSYGHPDWAHITDTAESLQIPGNVPTRWPFKNCCFANLTSATVWLPLDNFWGEQLSAIESEPFVIM